MTLYPHTAPRIRFELISAMSVTRDAAEESEKLLALGRAQAYKESLRVLMSSEDYMYESARGIADEHALNPEWIQYTIEWLGEQAYILLGIDPPSE